MRPGRDHGGEPLLQRDVYPLMDRLLESGLTVMVETGGQIIIYWKAHVNEVSGSPMSGTQEADVEERDINRDPPTRAFLERTIEADRFLDFVSTRRPRLQAAPASRIEEGSD